MLFYLLNLTGTSKILKMHLQKEKNKSTSFYRIVKENEFELLSD